MSDTNFYLNDNSASVSSINLAPEADRDDTTSDLKLNGSTETQVNRVEDGSVGILPDSVYDSSLVWWRSAMRRRIMLTLKQESAWIARIQAYRTPLLDTYFLYTSSLGTHTFYMLLLPACYFFGYDQIARTLMAIVGLGIYWSSFFKDLVCSPRPYAPPVSRLTMGTHHLEYGFPSSHSTNTISMTLYFYTLLYRFYTTGTLSPSVLAGEGVEITPGFSPSTFHALQLVLALYASTVVFGRIYCGMHSITDCVAGSLLGAVIWGVHWLVEDSVDAWTRAGGLEVPLTFSLLSLLLINYHPQPVDDCPCFEDAVACIAALLGTMLGWWHGWWSGLFHEETSAAEGTFKKFPITQMSNPVVLLIVGTRLVVGIASIFALRLILKSTLHLALPPLYRILSKLVSLPNRRFYTPATEYNRVPLRRGWERLGPSVVDLGELGVGSGSGGEGVVSVTGRGQRDVENGGLKNRNPYFGGLENAKKAYAAAAGSRVSEERGSARSYPNGTSLVVGHEYENEFDDDDDSGDETSVAGTEKEAVFDKTPVNPVLERPLRKRYDAEVLTKIVVYVAIGLIASEFAPVLFEVVGL